MTEIRFRRGTAVSASENNPILAEGEPGWEKDTQILKIGDGVTPWLDLQSVGVGSLDQLEDVNLLTPEDKQMLVYDAQSGKWTAETPVASFDQLDGVDLVTTPPKKGDVLIYDDATGLWKPGLGGPEVGTWENNLQTNFIYPAPVEVSQQTYPLVWPNARLLAPFIELTVTESMLVTNTGVDFGHETGIHLLMSNLVTAISGTGNPTIEAAVLRAGSGFETVYAYMQQGAPSTANQRFATSIFIAHVKVGDKLRVRQWSGTNAVNFRTDWWGYRSVVSKVGHKVDGGRIGLFRDIVRTGTVGTWLPSTVLSNAPSNWASGGSEITREQWLDSGVHIGANVIPVTSRSLLSTPTLGIMTLGDALSQTDTRVISSPASSAQAHGLPNVPVQYQADRLWIPAPPTT